MHSDIVIVGKGIAGLVLSFFLEKKGIRHLILDRKSKVRPFALAETIPPSAMPLLHSPGLIGIFEENSIRKTYGYHSLWGSEKVIDNNFFFQHPYKYGLKINKASLLIELEGINRSTIIQYEHQLELQIKKEGVTITVINNGTKKVIHARAVIDATGRSRAILKALNIPISHYDNCTSFSCHLPRKKHSKLRHDVYVESFKDGWGLVSGLNESHNVVSTFTHNKSLIFNRLKEYNNWKNILNETSYLKYFLTTDDDIKVRGGLANSSKPELISGGNWLAIGDAALAFDPLCSHGITNAIYTAQKASEAIAGYLEYDDDDAFDEYNESLNSIFDAYLKSKNELYRSETRWREKDYWSEYFKNDDVAA